MPFHNMVRHFVVISNIFSLCWSCIFRFRSFGHYSIWPEVDGHFLLLNLMDKFRKFYYTQDLPLSLTVHFGKFHMKYYSEKISLFYPTKSNFWIRSWSWFWFQPSIMFFIHSLPRSVLSSFMIEEFLADWSARFFSVLIGLNHIKVRAS